MGNNQCQKFNYEFSLSFRQLGLFKKQKRVTHINNKKLVYKAL